MWNWRDMCSPEACRKLVIWQKYSSLAEVQNRGMQCSSLQALLLELIFETYSSIEGTSLINQKCLNKHVKMIYQMGQFRTKYQLRLEWHQDSKNGWLSRRAERKWYTCNYLLAISFNIWKIFCNSNDQCKQCHKRRDESHRCTANFE